MSSKFEPHHGEERSYNGYEMHKGKIALASGTSIHDFSITKNVASLFITAGLLLFVFLTIAKSYKTRKGKAPKGLQSWLEPIILFVRDDIAKPTIGHKYQRFMPLLLTIFFFIFFGNLLGLIPIFPGGANLTGNIAIPFFLASVILITIIVIANKHYWGHIIAMPGVPKLVLLILTPIELLGFVLRPFVLMIRLFANISAGHIIALAFYSLIWCVNSFCVVYRIYVLPRFVSRILTGFCIYLTFINLFRFGHRRTGPPLKIKLISIINTHF